MKLNTGLDETKRKEIEGVLSRLLADTSMLSMKTQSFHWNVAGPLFYSVHNLTELQYTELALATDLIAERIRALGFHAPGSFSQFQKLTHLKEETSVPKAEGMIEQLVQDHESIVRFAREAAPKIAEFGDDSTADILVTRIEAHEKAAWMLRTLLG